MYKVGVKISPTTPSIVDFADVNRDTHFSKPLNADRLSRLDLPELELMPDHARRLDIQDEHGVTWHARTNSRFLADGRVFLVKPDGSGGEWTDLAKEKYRYML